MKKIKILLTACLLAFFVSCSTLTAEERYQRGEFIEALETTAKELREQKNPLTQEELNQISYRIKSVEQIYENKLRASSSTYSKADAYFDLWQMGVIVERNPILMQYSTINNRYNTQQSINNAVSYIVQYVNEDKRSRVQVLDKYINKFKDSYLKSQYMQQYSQLVKLKADIYYDLAVDNEYMNNLKTAADQYYIVYKTYSEFDSNYRNSRSRYYEITKELEIKEANEYYKEATIYYNNYRDLTTSKNYFERAKYIYNKYNYNQEVNNINAYLEIINTKINEEKFNDYYNLATESYDKGRYQVSNKNDKKAYYSRAINYYKEALKYTKNYSIIDSINRNIESIQREINNLK